MTGRIASILLAFATLAVVTAEGAAARQKPEAEFPARAGKSRLVFECAEDKSVWLRVWYPVRGWRGDRAAEVRIDGRSFETVIDGATDSFILSDVPLPQMGVTADLLSAAKAGKELVLAGLAAEQIPGPSRSFPLTGGRAKIERVEKACGRPVSG